MVKQYKMSHHTIFSYASSSALQPHQSLSQWVGYRFEACKLIFIASLWFVLLASNVQDDWGNAGAQQDLFLLLPNITPCLRSAWNCHLHNEPSKVVHHEWWLAVDWCTTMTLASSGSGSTCQSGVRGRGARSSKMGGFGNRGLGSACPRFLQPACSALHQPTTRRHGAFMATSCSHSARPQIQHLRIWDASSNETNFPTATSSGWDDNDMEVIEIYCCGLVSKGWVKKQNNCKELTGTSKDVV